MDGHELAVFVLLVFSGLLGSLEWRPRALMYQARRPRRDGEPSPGGTPDQAVASPVSLNPIELALIAELSLEMARDSEAVANDATKRLETRRSASTDAIAWRERARLFQLEADRLSGHPIVPGVRPIRAYAGPERRRRMRRTHTRRADPASAGHGRDNRRAVPERRQRDRRCPQPVPR